MKRLLSFFSLFVISYVFPVQAQVPIEADLITQNEGILPDETQYVALKLTLPRGWHVYWKNSGDSGEPTELKLDLPSGFQEIGREWPVPEKINIQTLTEFGYKQTAYLVVKVKAPENLKKGNVLSVQGKATWLACKSECVPMQADVSAFWVAGKKGRENPELTQVIKELPILQTKTAFRETATGFVLKAPLHKKAEKAQFFPNQSNWIMHGATQDLKTKNGDAYLFMTRTDEEYEAPENLAGTLVYYNALGDKVASYLVDAPKMTDALPVFEEFQWSAFLLALLMAVAGGFLLNLMPCVFPVLSLKAFSLIKAKSNQEHFKQEATLYTAGVLFSFAVIGAILIALRSAGAELGWGFQLQYPPFVLALCLFMFFLGLLFSDLVVVGEDVSEFGMNMKHNMGHFGTGVLAVFVASPCAAPFMGVALGYGLMNPAPITMAVLLAMGIGLSLPFLILGYFPKTAKFLPKPGAWLDLFRKVLAFPLFGAAAWLLWVLSAQEGSLALAWALVSLTCIGFATWLYGVCQQYDKGLIWARIAAVLTVVLTCYSIYAIAPQKIKADENIDWIPYQSSTVDEFRRKKMPVFLKFSARWCLTCLVNDQTTFADKETIDAFKDKGIAAFFGDWTNRNDDITAAIESYRRGGIPLYIYYAPGADKPVILPQIITPREVIKLFR